MKIWPLFVLILFISLPFSANAQELSPLPTDTPIPPTITPSPVSTLGPTSTPRIVNYGSRCIGGCITATPSPRREYVRSATPTLIPTLVNKPTNTPTSIKKRVIPVDTPTPTYEVESNTPTSIKTTSLVNKTHENINPWQRVLLWWNRLVNRLFNKEEITETVIQDIPTTITPTLSPIEEIPIPTTIPTKKYIPKPTITQKPPSTINENILKTKFGINNPDLITSILGDNGQLEKYEREYYGMIKGWSEIDTTSLEQRIFIPSLNTTKICKTAVIIDIKNASINVDNVKAKMSGGYQKLQSRLIFVKSVNAISLDEQIQSYTKDLNLAKEKLNELISKFCR